MKPLPVTFRSDGFDFRQRQREGDIVLLEKSKGRVTSFEVVRVQRRNERFAFGNVLPAGEVMPPSESWGRLGWSFADLESARKKFCALAEAQERPAFRIPKPVNRILRAQRVFAHAGRNGA